MRSLTAYQPQSTPCDMPGNNPHEILYLLIAAVFIVALFKRLRLSPVLGYLVAGGAIGPHGLNYIPDTSSTQNIAEFGVVFLLFMIGLELTFERLKNMRKHVFGFGTAQMVITGLIIGLVVHQLGVAVNASIVIGAALALSSTAVALQVLAERGEQSTQVGRLSLATLILQDLAVVPLLIMVPLMAEENVNIPMIILVSLGKTVIVLLLILIVGRQLLRPLFRSIAYLRSHELFIATTLLILLGTAFFTKEMGLSYALGAFVAGLLVAETEYSPQVEADIEPFKGLLMGLFFMSVGMSLNLDILLHNLGYVLLMCLALILVKSGIIMLLARAFGFRPGCSVQTGLLLSQGGEFAFVLFTLGLASGLFDQNLAQTLMVVITITMALTPLLSTFGKNLARRLDLRNPVHFEDKDLAQETMDLDSHTVVLGFGKTGETICRLLRASGIRFVAVDSDPKHVHRGQKEGYPVYYGKPDKLDILRSIGMDRANAVAITLDERARTNAAVRTLRRAYPELPIVVRAQDRKHANDLRDMGATVALAELFESSLMLGSVLLKKSGIPSYEAGRIVEEFRASEDPKSQVRYFFRSPPPFPQEEPAKKA